MNRTRLLALISCAALTLCLAGSADAQVAKRGSDPEHKLNLTWDRWLDHTEVGERLKLMERTWPKFLKLQSLGKSYGQRDIWMMTVSNPATGPEMSKAAMFIEANVHGNEIQGTEVSLYTIWYLMENYERIPTVRRLVDERVFYIVPTINPDGRDFFLHGTGAGSRTGHVPV
ncbi:MAG: M14 family zinc carboxypeptidase, partial [Gemmatimonadaceae bacterium]